jgi:hypothetical protein
MDSRQFIQAIRVAVRQPAIHETMDILGAPPDRVVSSEKEELATWINSLSALEKKYLERALSEAVDSALFGFLCVLDGVRVIEDDEEKGDFELWYKGEIDTLVNSDIDFLHDLYISEP